MKTSLKKEILDKLSKCKKETIQIDEFKNYLLIHLIFMLHLKPCFPEEIMQILFRKN